MKIEGEKYKGESQYIHTIMISSFSKSWIKMSHIYKWEILCLCANINLFVGYCLMEIIPDIDDCDVL